MADAGEMENSLLLMQFRQFCGELLHLRNELEQASGAPVRAATPEVEAAAAAPPSPAAAAYAAAAAATAAAIAAAQSAGAVIAPPEPIAPAASASWPGSGDLIAAKRDEGRQRLLNLFEQQTYQSMALGGSYGIDVLKQAQYVMAALGDEVLLSANWPGKAGWRLLEEEVFRSHSSGEMFFTRLDALLAQGDAGSPELAMIFFQALALNFCGRYRKNDPRHVLARYRRQLYLRLFHRAPETSEPVPIFPGAYDVTDTDTEFRRLPNPHRWWYAVGGVVLLWLLVSFVAWRSLVGPLDRQLQRIQRVARGVDNGTTRMVQP